MFVSYSHADKHHRRAVEAMLQQHDIAYIVDAKEIDLGEEITDWALEKIQGCSHYLLILSRTSVSAPWCIAEYSMARGARITTLVYMERYSKPHVIEKKKSPRAASNASS